MSRAPEPTSTRVAVVHPALVAGGLESRFTLVDRSDSGRRTLAASNLAGAAAGGFIGMAYEPQGFNDATHGYQRAAVELTDFVSHNLTAEFSPEIAHIAHKLHFPDRIADSFLPPDRKQPQP